MFVKNIVIIISLVKLSVSVKCYDCNSVNNSMCLDPHLYDYETLNKYMLVTECRHGNLPRQDFFCRKIRQTILNKAFEPEVRITRGCGWKRHNLKCYKVDNEDHQETVCQCFGDLCNGADSTSATLVVGVLLPGIFYRLLL